MARRYQFVKQWSVLLACLVPALVVAQPENQNAERLPMPRLDVSVPPSLIDAEGAYVQYKAVLSNGTETAVLGRYLSASECFQRLELAAHSGQLPRHECRSLQKLELTRESD